MNWKGRELKTFGDFMEYGIDTCRTREEAQEFMRLYVAENPMNARANIGYMSGYYNPDKARQIRVWFEVVHPIFGNTEPKPEEAFEMGKRLAGSRRLSP